MKFLDALENNEKEKIRDEGDNTVSFRADDAYFEDDIRYQPYMGTEAEEIILPTEENQYSQDTTDFKEDIPTVTEEPKKKRRKKRPLIVRIFSAFINVIFLTGDNTIALVKWLIRKPLPLLFKPLKLWLKLVYSQLREAVHNSKNRPTAFSGKLTEIADRKSEDGSDETKKKRPPI